MQQRWAGTRNAAATHALHIALGSVDERGAMSDKNYATRATQGARKGGHVIGGLRTRRWACATSQNDTHRSSQIPSVPPLGARRPDDDCWSCKRAGGLECGAARQDEARRRDGETARRRDSKTETARLLLRVPVRCHGHVPNANPNANPNPNAMPIHSHSQYHIPIRA
jgi:hypothetical protein